MKEKIARSVALALAVILMASLLTSCGNAKVKGLADLRLPA